MSILFLNYRRNYSSFTWHGVNQTYDSFVNFTNRNDDTQYNRTSKTRFALSIFTATTLSTLAALRLERLLTSKICHPLYYVNLFYSYNYLFCKNLLRLNNGSTFCNVVVL